MIKNLLCFAVILALSGCATCIKPTFVKATTVNPSKEYEIANTPLKTYVQILDKVTLSIGECNSKLCAYIVPAVGTKVRFEKDELVVTTEDNSKNKVYKMSPIFYSWMCFKRKDEDKICTMSAESPTGKPTKVMDDETSIVGNDIMVTDSHLRSFDATLEFTGRALYMPSLFGNKPTQKGVQTFRLTLIDEYLLNTPTKIIKLPKLWVNNIQYTLPDFKLETVTEEICHYPH